MFNIFHRSKKPELFWTTDIHSHVCPGIDDGSPDVATSVRLVEGMAEMGFERMIVTPHVAAEVFPNTREIIDDAYGSLKEALRSNAIEMPTGVSAEYRIDDNLYNLLKSGNVRPLPGGEYILVENAWITEPYGLDDFLPSLRDKYGWQPVLAHPERYIYYYGRPERYRRLHDIGVKFQVNLLSLAGYYGKNEKKWAEHLLDENMVSFVGSDLHHEKHLAAIRSYLTGNDYKKLKAKSSLIENDRAFNL